MTSRSKRALMRFGRSLRRQRQEAGYSQRRFAELVGVSTTYWSAVEAGEADPPTAERIARAAELLGCDADTLMIEAGRVPADVLTRLRSGPQAIRWHLFALVRAAANLKLPTLSSLVEHARQMQDAKAEPAPLDGLPDIDAAASQQTAVVTDDPSLEIMEDKNEHRVVADRKHQTVREEPAHQ